MAAEDPPEHWPDPLAPTAVMTDDDRPTTAPVTAATRTPSESPTRTAQPRDARIMLEVGTRLSDRYEIRAFLGEGGMGAVYRAFDATLGEEVALKVVHGQYAARDSLRDEVRLAQKVTHRNVCRTYDLEEVGGQHLVKMEYIVGETLAARVATLGRLSIAQTIAIARAIADGLAAAHAEGIIHRDLKPGNVMLAGDRVVLMDFGLAQQVTGERSDYSGTPGYMSPEQMAGGAIDARSDLYSLGCLVYEMLTGERVLGKGTFEELWRRQREVARPDVRARRSDTPRWVARAVAALLASDPARRERGVAMLVAGPRRALVIAPIGVAAVAAIGGVLWLARTPPWNPTVTSIRPQFVENGDAPAISPDRRLLAYMADRGHPGTMAIFTVPIAGGDPNEISPHGMNCVYPRWSYRGDAVLMVCDDGGKRIRSQSLDGGAARDLGTGIHADACGPDDLVIVSVGGDTLVIQKPDGSRELLRGPPARPGLLVARCNRHGTHIVYTMGPDRDHLAVFVADRAGVVRPVTSDAGVFAALAPDADSIVFTRMRDELSELYEVTLADGVIHSLAPAEPHAFAPDISSDGGQLVFDRDITYTPLVEHGTNSGQRTSKIDKLADPAPSPRGGIVVVRRQSDGMLLAIDLATGIERALTRGGHPFFDREGGRVLFESPHKAGLLQAIPIAGGPIATLGEFPGEILGGFEAADGIHVELDRARKSEAWLLTDGRATPEGTEGRVLPAPSGGWRAVYFSVDGKAFVRLVPPGQPLSSGERYSSFLGRPAWLDDHRFAYCDDDRCHVRDVLTGEVRATDVRHDQASPIAVGPGGDHWFTTPNVGQVTRHLITNFADRPWAPK